MKRMSILSGIVFLCMSSMAQEKTFSSEHTYYVYNLDLGKILYEFIEHEKQYDYFDPACIFNIQVYTIDSTINFLLMSGSRPSEISDWTFWEEINDKYFILKYYEYTFLLYSRSGEGILDTNLLIKRNERFQLKVGIAEKVKNQGKETLGFDLSVIDDLSNINDDPLTPTVWMISYYDGRFYEISRFARNYGRIK